MTLRRSATRNALRSFREQYEEESAQRRASIMNPALGAASTGSATRRLMGQRAMESGIVEQGEETTWMDRIPTPVAGAVRGLASLLEPLQLPQDAFFAAVAGAIDPDTTIAERLGRMQWRHYAPGGEAPARVADGQEILRLAGFNETVSKWGGIGADLIVDPLVFGTWFRVAGKLTKSAELVSMGNRIDRALSPAGAVVDTNRFLRRSDSYAKWQDTRMEGLFDALRNPDSQVFGIQRFGEKATRFMDWFVPEDAMLNVRFGQEIGQEFFRHQAQARIAGRDLSNQAILDIQRVAYGANGEMQQGMVRSVIKAMDEHAIARDGILGRINSTVLRRATDSAVYDVANQQRGAALIALGGGRVPTHLDEGGRLTNVVDELRTALAADFGKNEAHNAQRIIGDVLGARYEDATAARRNALIELAGEESRKLNLSASEVEHAQRVAAETFDELLATTLSIDARIGLATSGYDFIATNLRRRGLELGASVDQIEHVFNTVLSTGLRKGQKGIDELWDTATGIKPLTPGKHSQAEVMRRIEDVRIRTNALRGYTGELNSMKAAAKDLPNTPRRMYESDMAVFRSRSADATDAARTEREATIKGVRQRAAQERADLKAGPEADIRARRDAELEGLKAEAEAAKRATSDEYTDILFNGEVGTVIRSGALADAVIRLSPQRLSPRITTNPLFSELPAAGKKLREATVRYRAFADDIIDADFVTDGMATRFIRAEKEVLDLVTEQERLLTSFAEALGDVSLAGRAGPSNTLVGLRGQVETWLKEARELRVSLENSHTIKTAQRETVAEAQRGFREWRADTARNVRAQARADIGAGQEAVRQAANADIEAARTRFGQFQEGQRLYRQRARDARDAGVDEMKDRAAGARASMEAEYKAAGRGKPGSTADRMYVARSAAGRPEPRQVQRAVALDGSNTSIDEILTARLVRAEHRLDRGGRVDPDRGINALTRDQIEELLEAELTFGELLGGISEMQALPLGEFLQGVMNGHLRKAYGLFMDGQNFQTYIDRVQRGSILSGNLLDEMNIRALMPGLEAEADLITGYHNALRAAGGGQILRKNDLVAHLTEHGVSGERINRSLEALVRGMHNNPAFDEAMDLLKARQVRYTQDISDAQRTAARSETPMVANRRFFQERVNLPEKIAATLGEHAESTLSVFESARVANRVVARQEVTQRLYTMAKERGLIKSAPFVDQHGARYVPLGQTEGALGGFAGQYVHPYLVSELQRLANVETPFLGAGFQRLRSLITGGYLASPSVLAANFVGGFYQAATAGINPVVMARRMAEVLPDMVKASKGEVSDLMKALKQHLDLEMSSLVGSERIQDFQRLISRNIEMSPEGMRKFADDIATWYEDFLQRPGLGKFRVPFAGLEGFQFSENWFKVAAFKEIREQVLREGLPGVRGGPRRIPTIAEADQIAAEYARTVVFDYSSLPRGLEMLKKTGVVMFPGFPYFLATRTLGAALNRPGTLAVADRLTEALGNISLDPLDQIDAYLGLPEWLREEQGTPLPLSLRTNRAGHDQVSMIPFAQLVPTNTIWDGLFGKGLGSNPWAESVTQLGMWGPLYDVFSALVYNEGDATITARFGHRVHDAGAEGAEQAAQVFRFLWNTMAPSVVRRGLSVDYQGQLQGFLPAIGEMLGSLGADMPEELARALYTFDERRTGRPERTWREDMIASFLRTPTVVALEGPLAGIRQEMESARNGLNGELAALMTRYRRAQNEGNEAEAERLFRRMQTKRDEFNETWADYVSFYRANLQRRQQQREAQAR